MTDIVEVASAGLTQVLGDIDRAVAIQKGDSYFSIQDIAKHGWIGGAKYAAVKRLVDGGIIKSITLQFPNRSAVKKIHAEDLKAYVKKAYS